MTNHKDNFLAILRKNYFQFPLLLCFSPLYFAYDTARCLQSMDIPNPRVQNDRQLDIIVSETIQASVTEPGRTAAPWVPYSHTSLLRFITNTIQILKYVWLLHAGNNTNVAELHREHTTRESLRRVELRCFHTQHI